MSVEDNQYNSKELKKFKKIRRNKRLLRFVIYGIVFLLAALISVDYFARFPRERHAKNARYTEKALLGFQKFLKASKLTITADNDDLKNSKLQIAELYIKGNRLDKLTKKLPFSGENYQKAKFKLGSKTFKVDVKLKGDSINHWAFPQKSWRIKLKKDKEIDGMQTLNLNVPRLETQIGNYLGYTLAKEMDAGLVPEVDYVHFRLNRKFDGIRLLLEQPDQNFLSRRNLPAGKIFNGDINSLQIYGGVKREKLYSDIKGWESNSPGDYLEGNKELEDLLNIIAFEHNPYKFYDKINNILEIDDFLKYIALLELVSSVHVDETHNNKIYFNPVSGKFSPIVWDTVAYHWKNKYNPDIAVNKFFRVILSNPEYRERKDKFLYNALTEKLTDTKIIAIIKNIVQRVAPDLKAFALKIYANDKGIHHISNQEWESSINELVSIVKQRNQKLKMHLSNSDVSYNFNTGRKGKATLVISVNGPIGINLEKIIIKQNNLLGNSVRITRRGSADVYASLGEDYKDYIIEKENSNTLEIKLNDHLFSKRRYNNGKNPEVVPGKYYYDLDGISNIESIELFAKNAINNKKINLKLNKDFKITNEHKKNSVWWKPSAYRNAADINLSGNVILDDHLIVEPYSTLNIHAGTKILLKPGKAILVRGKLNILGNKDNNVIIDSLESDNPMGGLAISNGKAKINYLTIIGGRGFSYDNINFEAPFNIYNSSVLVKNSKFINSNILAKYSSLNVNDSSYTGILENGITSYNSTFTQNNYTQEIIKATHSTKLIGSKAYGTPSRTEREFKFSLIGVDTEKQDLEALAKEVHKALSLSLSKAESNWSAPKYTGTNYYLDDDIGKFLFRDYYFDTKNNELYNNQISYRYRNRYSNLKDYKRHIKNPYIPEYWPYRLEFQAKVNRKEVGNGFSTVDEARFEFRKESAPFSINSLPPSPPWDEEEFFKYFKSGNFRGLKTLPAKVIVETLGAKKDLEFFQKLLLLTERFRQHFNIKSNFGSGPNPDQSYIISLDKVDVFDGFEYQDYVFQKKLGDNKIKEPSKLGIIIEIEVEFERNVSDVLDKEIKKARANNDNQKVEELTVIREAFLSDLQNIMNVIKEYFSTKGIEVQSATKSKYVQAAELR